MRYLGVIFLIYVLIAIAGILFVGVFLGGCYIKKKRHKMDEQKWNAYFKSMDDPAYIRRFFVIYTIALTTVSGAGYFIFKALGFTNPMLLSVLTIILGGVKMGYNFNKYKVELLEKITQIRDV